MNRMLLDDLDVLLPLAAEWVCKQERHILATGVGLDDDQMRVARALDIEHPHRIRLLRVERIPRPEHPTLRYAAEAVDFISPTTMGLTVRYGIYIRASCWNDSRLIAHELVHTRQYERLGSVEAFLRQYLTECLTVGYDRSPLEQEAVERSRGL